jgi:hypothetical protein
MMYRGPQTTDGEDELDLLVDEMVDLAGAGPESSRFPPLRARPPSPGRPGSRPTGPSRYPPLRARPPSPGRPGSRPTGPSRYPPLPGRPRPTELTSPLARLWRSRIRDLVTAPDPVATLRNTRNTAIGVIQTIVAQADSILGAWQIDAADPHVKREVESRLALRKVRDHLRDALAQLVQDFPAQAHRSLDQALDWLTRLG